VILVSTLFETKVIIATKIRREKNENCVEFSFHSISGSFLLGFLSKIAFYGTVKLVDQLTSSIEFFIQKLRTYRTVSSKMAF